MLSLKLAYLLCGFSVFTHLTALASAKAEINEVAIKETNVETEPGDEVVIEEPSAEPETNDDVTVEEPGTQTEPGNDVAVEEPETEMEVDPVAFAYVRHRAHVMRNHVCGACTMLCPIAGHRVLMAAKRRLLGDNVEALEFFKLIYRGLDDIRQERYPRSRIPLDKCNDECTNLFKSHLAERLKADRADVTAILEAADALPAGVTRETAAQAYARLGQLIERKAQQRDPEEGELQEGEKEEGENREKEEVKGEEDNNEDNKTENKADDMAEDKEEEEDEFACRYECYKFKKFFSETFSPAEGICCRMD